MLYGLLDQVHRVEDVVIHQLVELPPPVVILNLTKTCFRRVEVWLVGHVEYRWYAELVHLLEDVVGLVEGGVVHEDGDLGMLVLDVELIEVLGELHLVYAAPVDAAVFDALLLRYCQEQAICRLVDPRHRNTMLGVLDGVVGHQDRLGGEPRLIEVDDAVTLCLELSYPQLDRLPPLLVLGLLLWLDLFGHLDPLSLDPV